MRDVAEDEQQRRWRGPSYQDAEKPVLSVVLIGMIFMIIYFAQGADAWSDHLTFAEPADTAEEFQALARRVAKLEQTCMRTTYIGGDDGLQGFIKMYSVKLSTDGVRQPFRYCLLEINNVCQPPGWWNCTSDGCVAEFVYK